MRLRPLAGNLLLMLCSIAVVVGGIEVGLRVTGLQRTGSYTPPIYAEHPDEILRYALRPEARTWAFRNWVTTNALGYRSPAPQPEQRILLALGDSMTFGYGVADEETLPARLEQRLEGWSVQNAAVPGYDLLQEIATYEGARGRLQPDALLLVFYPNDLTSERAFLDATGVLRPQSWDGEETCAPVTDGILALIPGACWLDLHSAFYKAVKKVVRQRTTNAQLAEQQQQSAAAPGSDPAIDPQRWMEYEEAFEAFSDTLGQLPRVFALLPDQYVRTDLRAQLRSLGERNGWTVVDLFDVYGNAAPTLGWDTVHLSADALDALAAHIAAEAAGVFSAAGR